ncbi:hypothetical protein [Desulfosporosinus lacus]|uniref:Uncharacterized protein n=1 Tax=Desulfosporosinus lacus DSM 15449 TaxID=1121420 RepID=A0A1M6BBZ5_9FIRM|nr:hypothetical protein [Desulfosporosinus lacus]SHI46242.1 hypothetical protein SAMN02746098_04140 [Desulfosporosinus lacus DSM 15449]
MLPTSYAENAYWFKFQNMKLSNMKKGYILFLRKKAERIVYNPYDIGDRLITDSLKFGKALSEGLSETAKINGALGLARKYGLLGVLSFTEYRTHKEDSFDSGWTIALVGDDGGFMGEKSFQKYIYEYFPLPDRQPPIEFDQDVQKSFLQYNINYSERVGWIARKAHDLYRNFKHITDFKNTMEIENLPDKEYMDKLFDCRFKIKNIDFAICYDEQKGAYLNWEADNLQKMLDIIYALKLIDKKTGLSTCENCKTPFFKHRKDMKYCSDDFGNSYRVYRGLSEFIQLHINARFTFESRRLDH